MNEYSFCDKKLKDFIKNTKKDCSNVRYWYNLEWVKCDITDKKELLKIILRFDDLQRYKLVKSKKNRMLGVEWEEEIDDI